MTYSILKINKGAYYNIEVHRILKKLLSEELNVLIVPDSLIIQIKELLTINKEVKTIDINEHSDENKIKIIENVISDKESVKLEKIYSDKRNGEFVKSRHLIAAFIAALTKFTYAYIANHMNYKEHASIINAKRKVKNYIDTEDNYKEEFKEICNIFNIDFDYVYNRL